MNGNEVTQLLWQHVAILFGEVLVVTAVLWILLRSEFAAVWRRTFCRAGVVCALMIVGLEFSGSGRSAARWITVTWSSAAKVKARPSRVEVKTPASNPRTIVIPSRGESEHEKAQTPSLAWVPGTGDQGLLAGRGLAPAETKELNDGVTEPPIGASRVSTLVCLLVWLTGAAMLIMRAIAGRFALSRWRKRCQTIQDKEIISAIARWSRALGIRHTPIRLIESPELPTPIAFGIFRPTIALPREFRHRFSSAAAEAMLAHEVSHLAGRDPLWCLLADVLVALLWWHPAVWWVRHQLRLTSELAADDSSLLIADGPRVLSECLVELGTQLVKRPALGQLSAGGFRSSLGCRVERLLQIEGRAFAALDGRKAAMVTILGPMALAAMVVVCSAWTAPGEMTKGKNMKATPKQKSLALLALTAMLGSIDHPVIMAQGQPGAASPPYGRGTGGPVPQSNFAPGAGGGGGGVGGADQNRFGGFGGAADPFGGNGLPQRPGAGASGGRAFGGGFSRGDSERIGQLDAKLRDIVLDEVSFDGLPLAEVLRFVSEESRKHDPEKKGINFLLKPSVAWAQQPPGVDPTTGLPVAAPVEAVDAGATTIKFNLPLRHISMKDLLDAIVKVADRPIEYSLEDYGVVFGVRPEGAGFAGGGIGGLQPQPPQPPNRLAVQTFHVNTNTFAASIENVFGIKLGNPGGTVGKEGMRPRQVQGAMKELLAQLGINLEGGKTVFYNEITGVLMVRATVEDLDVVRAAIETLGEAEKDQPAGVGFAPGPAQGQPNAALTDDQRRFRARYGLDVPGR